MAIQFDYFASFRHASTISTRLAKSPVKRSRCDHDGKMHDFLAARATRVAFWEFLDCPVFRFHLLRGKVRKISLRYSALFCMAIMLCGNANAQETNPQSSVLTPVIPAEQTYFVQLIEFRIKSTLDHKLGANEIVQMFDQLHKDGKIEVIENVRLSTLERHESWVTFGVRTSLTSSTSGNAQTRLRPYQGQNIGTIIRVKASPQRGKVLIEFDYERSYLNGKGTDELPPDIIQSTFKSTLLLETGKPTLVGGTTSDATDFLIVTINK